MDKPVTIAIIDDEVLFRKSLILLVSREETFQVVFDGENGLDLLSYLESTSKHPDIVLLDIRMSVMDGIETSQIITEKYPHIKMIILSSIESDLLIEQMIYYGAAAYLVKKSHPEIVIKTIKQVHKNGIYFDANIMSIIINAKRKGADNRSKDLFCGMSTREIEILNLICQQYNTKEIADRLFLSERTVDGHRKRMLDKTHSKNVIGLILWGIKNQVLAFE
ncbi:MAG: response regulator transcription factor [Flavobacteriia bacterium]|nr:response regulator transcription factor [Flavobacteriia bacterium]OJX37534.1 MAG: hypothetical protein BGO87_00805 [Flavobacteriia bacterium 40-80]